MDLNIITGKSANLSKSLSDWLFPKVCRSCKSFLLDHETNFCTACYENLPFQQHNCMQCGQLLGASLDYCGACISNPPAVDVTFCPYLYEPPISGLIQKYKYDSHPELATVLSNLMLSALEEHNISMPDLIIPVPLHITKLRERGFNQSLLLAKSIAKQLNIPSSNNVISKHRSTSAQANLGLKQRKRNLKNCFKINDIPSAKHIAIVDDVHTTGTTANEIAKILKKNGVQYVQVWGIAHTV